MISPEGEPEFESPKYDMDKPITTDTEAWDLVPPDGGWGWLVLAGSMLVNILIPGTIKSFGVLFVEFTEAFDTTPAQVRWRTCISWEAIESSIECSRPPGFPPCATFSTRRWAPSPAFSPSNIHTGL